MGFNLGVLLGLGIDAVFKVSPWGTIICLMLGFMAGVRNVVAAANKANRAPEEGPEAGKAKKGEGDSA